MAGIYLHVPFCKQACHYCDFHFSTNTEVKKELLHAMSEEISLQAEYLRGETIHSVYFGGGTPSLLTSAEVELLIGSINRTFAIEPDAEITLEANPDDLTKEKCADLKRAGINRLSIGIQSFDDNILQYLNRAHASHTAIQCVEDAQSSGFKNISIDLIYAIPGLTTERWSRDIDMALQLHTQHISAYTLTIEEKTAFGRWREKGRILPVSEPVAAEQMELLVTKLANHGFRQYEISNFALPGYESQHNGNYWSGGTYVGIGPSAHSYDGKSRQHNVANNHLYVRALKEKKIPAEHEILHREDQINEYLLTALRTDEGCDLELLKRNFGYDVLTLHGPYLRELEQHHLIALTGKRLRLTDAGKLLADRISSDLFLVE